MVQLDVTGNTIVPAAISSENYLRCKDKDDLGQQTMTFLHPPSGFDISQQKGSW